MKLKRNKMTPYEFDKKIVEDNHDVFFYNERGNVVGVNHAAYAFAAKKLLNEIEKGMGR